MVKGVMITMGMVGMAYADNPYSHYALFNSSLLNSWTGLYAGVNAGVAFNNAQLNSQQLGFTNPNGTCNTSSDFSTFSPGVQLGYLYQFSNDLVSGIEANVTINANQTTTLGCNSNINPRVYDRFNFRDQMQTSVKGRMGRALNWNKNVLLPYLTAGASFARVGLTYKNEGGNYYSNTTTQAGCLIGAGIEWAFMQHWSLRAEYYYVDYGNTINLNLPSIYGLQDPNGNGRVDLSANNVVLALNYWV